MRGRGDVRFELKEYKKFEEDYMKIEIFDDTSTELYLTWADKLLSISERDKAILKLNRLLELEPDHEQGLLERARAYAALNNTEAAIVDYQRILVLDPDNRLAHRELTILLCNLQRFKDAAPHAEQGKQDRDTDITFLEAVGQIKYHGDELGEAKRYFQDALKIDPYRHETIIHLADTLYKMKRYMQAIDYYEQLREQRDDDTALLLKLGICYVIVRKMEEASQLFDQVVQLDEKNISNLETIADSYFDHGAYREAISYYNRIVNLDYDHYKAFYHCGLAHKQLEEYNIALIKLQAALELKPQEVPLMFIIGEAFVKVGKFDEAVELFEQILTVTDNDARIYEQLTQLMYQLGRHSEALRYLKRLEDFQSLSTELIFLRADSLYHMDQLVSAELILKELLNSEPEHLPSKKLLGRILVDQKRFDEALHFFEQFNRVHRRDPEVPLMMGQVYFKQGNLNAAMEEFEKVLVYDETNEHAMEGLGECYLVKGDKQRALKQFKTLSEINPENIPCLIRIAEQLFDLDAYGEAYEYVKRAETVMIDRDALDYKPQIQRLMAFILMEEADYAQAHEMFIKMNDESKTIQNTTDPTYRYTRYMEQLLRSQRSSERMREQDRMGYESIQQLLGRYTNRLQERSNNYFQVVEENQHIIKNLLEEIPSTLELSEKQQHMLDDVKNQWNVNYLWKEIHDTQQDMRKTVTDHTQHMQDLTGAFSNNQTTSTAPLNKLIDEAVQTTASQSAIEFIHDYATTPQITGHVKQIKAALEMILEAISHLLNQSGEIRIQIEVMQQNVFITFQGNNPNAPLHETPDLFSPYVNKKHGMALQISRLILQEHGGDVSSMYHEDKGVVFLVNLATTQSSEQSA